MSEITINDTASTEIERRDAALSSLPEGEYAIVELFGHTTLVGRVAEVERFGTKMLCIEPLFRDQLLPPVYHGGAAIYRFTPCSPEIAFANQARGSWDLPPAIRAIMQPKTLAAPDDAVDVEGLDEGPF